MIKIISILSLLVSAYLVFLALVRTYNIAGIRQDIIDEDKKEELLAPLRGFVVIGLIGVILNIVSFIFFSDIILAVIGLFTFVACANSLYKIFDEIDKFNMSKKDSEILDDFLKNAAKDAKEKSK